MLRDRRRVVTRYIKIIAFVLIAEALTARWGLSRLCVSSDIMYSCCDTLFLGGIFILFLYILYVLGSHKIYKGIKYFVRHWKMMNKVRKSLKDAGYYVETYFRQEKVAVLPKIKISFTKDLTNGKIMISNNIKLDKRLEEVDVSSALGRYIVVEQYISDDFNAYIYEFEDAKMDHRLIFHSYDDFKDYTKMIPDYELFMDEKNVVRLSSLLLVGSTGSGKTYALYTLIFTMLNWKIQPHLYFCDPKNSSLVVLGNALCPDNTAGTVEDIIALLERFHQDMQERKIELQDKLNQRLDSDYRDWEMQANVLIFDEYSSFQSVVAGMDKKTRDHVSMMLRNIVLQGRQLGFFLWIVMQKSDASDIPTSIRDNLIWKIVLGNATRTTYLTAFESSADLPVRNFGCGRGLYSYQGLTRQPKITSFPTLDFDILGAVRG